jgi:putative glycosyltransferase (TIGR04372 family)
MKLPLYAFVVGFGRRKVLVCAPHHTAYGHLALDVLYALEAARTNRSSLLLIRPRDVVNEALYGIEAEDVSIRTLPEQLRSVSSAVCRPAFWLLPPARGTQHRTVHRRERLAAAASRRFPALGNLPSLALGLRADRDHPVFYYRRRVIANARPVRLPQERRRELERFALELGIPPAAKIVALHVRGPGFKRGKEVHDRRNARRLHSRNDSTRNADISTYFDAIDYLVGLGYTVVRLGDPTMEPVHRAGVIDLATSPKRAAADELYVLSRSEFFIASESGPQAVAFLTGTPTIVVNATDPISSYPIRPKDMYLLKTVADAKTGTPVALENLLEAEYTTNLRNTSRYRYLDNTRDEILAAVEEMESNVSGASPETPFQRAYLDRATAAAVNLARTHLYARKWGHDDGFLGSGRIAQVAESRWLGNRSVQLADAVDEPGR